MKAPSAPESIVKLFGMTNQLIESDLDRVEEELKVDLGRQVKTSVPTADSTYYPQFDEAVRSEAAGMSEHYELFYCLEKTIRSFVSDLIEDSEGESWWDSARVPQNIKAEVKKRIKRERDAGVTPRSLEPLDFTTFGELGELIKANWDIFGGPFSSQPAVSKVMASLNTLRSPIAHCCPLAEDEVVRLQLSVRDWFRLME